MDDFFFAANVLLPAPHVIVDARFLNDAKNIVEPDGSELGGLTGTLGEAGRFMIQEKPEGGLFRSFTMTEPLARPTLFLEFMLLRTEEEFCSFADKHGGLGVVPPIQLDDGRTMTGEPVWLWHFESRAMRDLWAIWECVQSKNIAALHDIMEWRSQNEGKSKKLYVPPTLATLLPPDAAAGRRASVSISQSGSWVRISPPFPDVHPRETWAEISGLQPRVIESVILGDEPAEGDYVYAAKCLIAKVLDSRSRTKAKMYYNPKIDKFRYAVTTAHLGLLEVLWLQFERAVLGDVIFKHCQRVGCGKPFEATRPIGGRRTDARYCSPKCKSAAQWDRGIRILALAAESKSAEDIAAAVGASVEAVKNHIKRSKKARGV